MLKIWGRANSSNVKKVLWTAKELGLAYERIDAGGPFGIVDTAAFRALNPCGLVPVLQDGDVTLWESNTIVRYLAARSGSVALLSDDPAARAVIEQWMDWSHSFAHPFREVVFGLVRTPPENRDMAAIERGIAACSHLFGVADGALGRTPWLSGAAFGLADIALGPFAYIWMELPIERGVTPNLDRWYATVSQRPAWNEVVAIGLT